MDVVLCAGYWYLWCVSMDVVLCAGYWYLWCVSMDVVLCAGYWYLHCHMEYHNHDGMALILRAGSEQQMPPLPRDFPRCGSFQFPATDFQQIFSLPNLTALGK
jgi:hypothetical protein